MRIGIDARMYKKGGTGISRYIKELVDGIVALDTKNTYILFLSPEMYHLYHCPKHVEKVKTDAPYYSLKEQLFFWKTLYHAKLDLMHFTHFNSPLLYCGDSIVTIHDITLSKFPGQKMNTFFHKLAYRITIWAAVKKAKHIITVSDHTKKDVIEMFHVPASKCTTTYLGVDGFSPVSVEERAVCRKKFGITKPSLLYVGVWRNHKNILNLIKVFNMLKSDGVDIQLLLTGKESPYYPEIRNVIEESLYKKDILTPGFVSEEDLRCLYGSVDMLVNPSFYEGFGVPPLEAMASNTLVAVSSVTSHPEVCKDAALYFDPYSLKDMYNVIKKGLTDTSLQEVMKKKGLSHSQHFRWRKTAQETLNVYAKVLNQ